jgi:outer membrane protein with beta-barrel domain
MKFSIVMGIATVMALAAPIWAQEGKLNFNLGGGVGVPLNPTADYAGVGGNFVIGAGYNVNKNNAFIGQYMWHGLPPTLSLKAQLIGVDTSSQLNAMTVNYRHMSQLTRNFGFYLIAGGGWYYRHSRIERTVETTTPIVCQPAYSYYGYPCTGGYVYYTKDAAAGTSAFGGNAGLGFTVRLSDSNWKFYIESRYHYANTAFVSSQVAPVTFGIMYR